MSTLRIRTLAHVIALAALVAIGSTVFPAIARADTTVTINFDNLPSTVGQITDQYAGDGVIFGYPDGFGFVSGATPGNNVVSQDACGPPSLLLTTSTHSDGQAARLGKCGPSEFPNHGTFAALSSTAQTVSAYVGDATGGTGDGFELDAYDGEHNYLGSSSITTAAPGINNLISFTSRSPNIAFVSVYMLRESDHEIGMDDFSFVFPPGAAPAIELGLSDTAHTSIGVRDGGTTTTRFTIERLNGSTGAVDMSITGLPAGVSYSFTPVGANDATTTLTLTAAASAPAAGATAIVTATPVVPSAGTQAAPPVHLQVYVAPAFSFNVPTHVAIANCQAPVSVSGGYLSVASGFTNPISVSAATNGPVSASFGPSPFSPSSTTPTLTLEPGSSPLPGEVETLTLEASSPGYPTQTATVPIYRTGLAIDSVSVHGGESIPSRGHPGSQITIDGTGFCPAGQVQVQFGNPNATATPSAITPFTSSTDTYSQSLTVPVPHLATPGPITVVINPSCRQQSGAFCASATTTQPYPVYGLYRDTDGYSWQNHKGGDVSFDDLADLYGSSQVYIQVDPCAWLTFGFANCSVSSTGIPTAGAFIYWLAVKGIANGGLCFGMATSSLQLNSGSPPLSSFPPAGAENTFALPESPALQHYVMLMQTAQTSAEWISNTQSEQSRANGQTAASLRNQLQSIMNTGDPAIVTIQQGNAGHAVIAYDVTDTGGGNYNIWIYNPNQPFAQTNQPWSASELGNTASAGSAHAADEQNASMITVTAAGQWSLAGGIPNPPWRGSLTSLQVYSPTAIPTSPTLPDTANYVLGYVFGSASLEQVSDPTGRTLIASQGGANLSPTRIPGATYLPATDGAHPAALLPNRGTYSLILRPDGQGQYAASLLGRALDAQVTASHSPAGSGSPTKLTLNTGTRALSIAPGTGRQPLAATLLVHAADGSAHEATLDLAPSGGGAASAGASGGGRYTIAFDRSSDTVEVTGAGASANVSLQLGWSGRQGLPQALTTPTIKLTPGETLTLVPSNWRALSRAPVAALITRRTGRRTRLVLHTKSDPGISVSSLSVAVNRTRRRPTLQIRASAAGLISSAHATLAWALIRAGRVIAVHSVVLPAVRLAHHTYTWRPAALTPGRYTLIGGIALVNSPAGSATLNSVSRRRQISFTVK